MIKIVIILSNIARLLRCDEPGYQVDAEEFEGLSDDHCNIG